jgi:molybdopterin biosynthesis enzyme
VVVTQRDGRYHARTVAGEQGSGVLTSMSKANGLAIVPEGTYDLAAGGEVVVQMLDWPEGTGA